jgi:hypothetical protein
VSEQRTGKAKHYAAPRQRSSSNPIDRFTHRSVRSIPSVFFHSAHKE